MSNPSIWVVTGSPVPSFPRLEIAASRSSAVDDIASTVGQFALDCGFQRQPFHQFAMPGERAETLERELDGPFVPDCRHESNRRRRCRSRPAGR